MLLLGSLAIHESLVGYFKGEEGIIQGDPLYPYLFVEFIYSLALKDRLSTLEGLAKWSYSGDFLFV